MDYQTAARQWETTRRRKLANNTYLEHPTPDSYAVRLHATNVVTWYADGRTILDSGGWRTATTKDRINTFADGLRVYSDKGVWYVMRGSWEGPRDVFPFADGITFHADGTVEGMGDDPREQLKLRAQLRRYARDYMRAFWAGKVPAPSGGDCWGCLMRTADGRKGMGGGSHILEHLAERYYVPSALACAVRRFPVSRWAEHSLAVAWNPEAAAAQGHMLKLDRIADEQLGKSLKRWLYEECGSPS